MFLKKLKILSKFDEKNYEMALEFFLEKILEMLAKIEDQQLNYQFFFEDLIQSISTLSLFSKFSDINYKILSKVFQNKTANFNQKFWHFINDQNMNYLSLLSTTKIKIDENNIEEIKSSKDKLAEKAMALSSRVYEEAAKAQQAQTESNTEQTTSESKGKDDNIKEANFEEK